MTVYINAIAPESAIVTVKRTQVSTFDFSDVTSAEFEVSKPDRSLATWAAAIREVTEKQIVIEHVFELGDVPSAGIYLLVSRLYVPAGVMRGSVVELPVTDPYKRKRT